MFLIIIVFKFPPLLKTSWFRKGYDAKFSIFILREINIVAILQTNTNTKKNLIIPSILFIFLTRILFIKRKNKISISIVRRIVISMFCLYKKNKRIPI